MQRPKLKVLAEAGAVCDIEVNHDAATGGWTVQVAYATRHGERGAMLERQRGGPSPPWTRWPGRWPDWA